MTHPLTELLDDLAGLVGKITPEQSPLPTPCPEYDVGELRRHVLGWLPVFATALADPDGDERPDPATYRAPEDAGEAAAQIRGDARTIGSALASGVGDRTVRLLGGELPGQVVVGMLTAEVVAHGWDLARAIGLPWQPPAELCDGARAVLDGMLQPQFRGPGKPFGTEVAVADDAPPLERLLAFSGRDPGWSADHPS